MFPLVPSQRNGQSVRGSLRLCVLLGNIYRSISQITCKETFQHSDAELVLQKTPLDETLGKSIFTSLKLWEDFFNWKIWFGPFLIFRKD